MVLLLAAASFAMESFPFFANNSTPKTRFETIELGQNNAGLSLYSQNAQLLDCFEALSGPVGMAQPTSRRETVINRCQDVALGTSRGAAGSGFSWYIAAHTAAELGQYSSFNQYLKNSQTLGPNEQWLAELRVSLGERHLEQMDRELKAGHAEDLKLLVQSGRGVASIAARYISHTQFRARITDIVETLPPNDQRRFISFVRAAAQNQRLAIQ